MDAYRGLPFELAESTVLLNFEANLGKTFCKQEKDVDLQIARFGKGLMPDECEKSLLLQQVSGTSDLFALSVSA